MTLNARGLLALLPLAILPSARLGIVAQTRPAHVTAAVPVSVRHAPLEGYVVTEHVSVASSDAATPSPGPITMRIKVAQGKLRIDMEMAQMAQMGAMYMLPRDSGKMVMVMASQGMAISMDMSMLGNIGSMAGISMPKFSDMTASLDDAGAGEKMLGYPTHKYVQHSTYTMTSDKGAVKMDVSGDMFMTTDVPGLAEGLQKFAEMFAGAFSGMAGAAGKDMADAMKGKMPKGFPMKVAVTSKQTDAAGVVTNLSTTVEVTEFTKATFDSADFEVPPGMQVMDMATMMGGRGGH